MESIARIRTVKTAASPRLLTNHRSTGIEGSAKIDRKLSRVGWLGIQLGSTHSVDDLIAVTNIHKRGSRKKSPKSTSASYRMIRDRILAPTGPLLTRWTDAIMSNSFGCWKRWSRDLAPAFTTTKDCEVERGERQQNRGDEDRHGSGTAHL